MTTNPGAARIRPYQLGAIEIERAEYEVLLLAARSHDAMIAGDTVRTRQAQRARSLGHLGLMRFVEGAAGGWTRGTWAAYLTCTGLNALWRHAGDTHVDCCGEPWNADGTCSGCGTRRRLDLPAYQQYLVTLSTEDRDRELRTSALWCIEHGYLRRDDVTTTKTCRFSGTPIHDGGLDRIGYVSAMWTGAAPTGSSSNVTSR